MNEFQDNTIKLMKKLASLRNVFNQEIKSVSSADPDVLSNL